MGSVKGFKTIKPKDLDVEGMISAIIEEADDVAGDCLLDFELTTATWTHQVRFAKDLQLEDDFISFEISTEDEIYNYVDKGTRPHIIRPKNAKALHFLSGYVAKTIPNVINSRNGGAFGSDVFAQEVHHPGTEARNFTKRLSEIWKANYGDRMKKAMKAAAKASGHYAGA